jgi:hypothetical protein
MHGAMHKAIVATPTSLVNSFVLATQQKPFAFTFQ